MYTVSLFFSNDCNKNNKNLMILTKTLQSLSNLFELENNILYMNFHFFCLISLIYLVFADFFITWFSSSTPLKVNL